MKSQAGDKLYVFYIGMLEDEKIFDFKIKRKHSDKGFVFTLGQGNVIKGWDQVYRVLDSI